MQSELSAKVEQSFVLTGRGRHEFGPQRHQAGIAIRHHGGQPVQRATQQHHDKPLPGRRRPDREGNPPRGHHGGQSQQSGAAGKKVGGHRL